MVGGEFRCRSEGSGTMASTQVYVLLLSSILFVGCYHPTPYGGPHYAPVQPGYVQPQGGYMQTQPGTLVIPPSDSSMDSPGTPTDRYEGEMGDDFRRDNSRDDRFFPEDDVPLPGNSGARSPDSDFNR